MKRRYIKTLLSILLICSFVSLTLFFYFTEPLTLINFLGVNNSYLAIFILAFIGGLTTFSAVPYHFVLITLAAGGLNIWLLGLISASGVILGDTTSYFIGYRGAEILPNRVHRTLQRFLKFLQKYPKLMPWFFLLYASCIPFSNDFIVISMGLAKYPFWRVMLPLAIGNIFFNTMVAYLAVHAYDSVQRIFL